MTSIGLPYAQAIIRPDGRYAVICPECGHELVGTGRTEDAITKSALRRYGRHFILAHPGPLA